jgi:hypothetical protein
VYGFVNKSREFPDEDLNRVFSRSKTGSLASRFAFHILSQIMPDTVGTMLVEQVSTHHKLE